MRLHPAADFGEHPHGVPRLCLRDIHDLVTVEHRQVRRFAELVDEPGQVRARPYAEHPRGGVAEPDQPRAENVLPRRLLADVAEVDERAQQPVDRGQGQAGLVGELRQREGAAGIGHQLEEREGALDRLHGPGAGLGFGAAVASVPFSYDGSLLSSSGGFCFSAIQILSPPYENDRAQRGDVGDLDVNALAAIHSTRGSPVRTPPSPRRTPGRPRPAQPVHTVYVPADRYDSAR